MIASPPPGFDAGRHRAEPADVSSAWTEDPGLSGRAAGPGIDPGLLGDLDASWAGGCGTGWLNAEDHQVLADEVWTEFHPGEARPVTPDGLPIPAATVLAMLVADIDDPLLRDVVATAARLAAGAAPRGGP